MMKDDTLRALQKYNHAVGIAYSRLAKHREIMSQEEAEEICDARVRAAEATLAQELEAVNHRQAVTTRSGNDF